MEVDARREVLREEMTVSRDPGEWWARIRSGGQRPRRAEGQRIRHNMVLPADGMFGEGWPQTGAPCIPSSWLTTGMPVPI